MTREGCDYSGARPTAEALRAAGRDFVVRYARKTGGLDKQITAAEAAYWRAEGIDVAIVDEVYAGRMAEGYAAGQTDARAARAAVAAVGGPADGGVIHFAADYDTTSDAQREAVANYLQGAASVLGWDRVGVYGEWQVIDWVHGHDRLPVVYLWQTYAWSGGVLHPAATLYQYKNGQMLGGVSVDYCRAYAFDFGQWPTGVQEDDVSYDDAVKALRDVLRLPAAGLAVPRGQTDNGNLAVILVSSAQAEYNRDAAEVTRDAAEARTLAALAAQVDPAAFADAVVAKLPAGISGGLTEDQVREAAGDALRDVLGGLNDPPPTAP
jgi:hypothetical protein